jgi:hypothetical protein
MTLMTSQLSVAVCRSQALRFIANKTCASSIVEPTLSKNFLDTLSEQVYKLDIVCSLH